MRLLMPLWRPPRKLLPVPLPQKPRLVKMLHLHSARKKLPLLPNRFLLPLHCGLLTVLWAVLHFFPQKPRRFAVLHLFLPAVLHSFLPPLLLLMPHFWLPSADLWFCQMLLLPKADFPHQPLDSWAVLFCRLRSSHSPVP